MLNTPFDAWVKNVYNYTELLISTWKTSVHFSTALRTTTHTTLNAWGKTRVLPQFIPSIIPAFSTQIIAQSSLLNTQLYTLSTPPIIKPKKEKIKKG